MVFILTEKIDDVKELVMLQHFQPDELPQSVKDNGYMFDSVPTPQEVPYKTAMLYRNSQTGELYFEYEDRPLTDIEVMANKIDSMEKALDTLIPSNV